MSLVAQLGLDKGRSLKLQRQGMHASPAMACGSHPFSPPQIHNAPELALFCEGFFLKHMKALLEQDSFRQLIYSRSSKVQGLDPLQDLQSTLAERVHSVYITSRV